MSVIVSKIRMVSDPEISKESYLAAKKIMEKIDPNDSLFVALAIEEKCGIWSDDKHFLQQKKIKIWTTKALAKDL